MNVRNVTPQEVLASGERLLQIPLANVFSQNRENWDNILSLIAIHEIIAVIVGY